MAGSANGKMSGTPQSPSRIEARRYNVERSCLRCHERKIRCDKQSPCSACTKSANGESCRYPSFERVKRRSRKHHTTPPSQKVETLEYASSNGTRRNSNSNPAIEARHSFSPPSRQNPGGGKLKSGSPSFTGLLIKDGNLVRYVNDHALSHILEKEDEIRSAMTSPYVSSNVTTPSLTARPLSLLHPTHPSQLPTDLERLLPARRRAIKLWQDFVLNIDPIIKVLHIPTIQPIVYAAISESQHAASDLHALLFAIYFSALTSTLRDAENASSEEHQTELDHLKHGLEISLSLSDFLEQPTMYSLQAMTIFLGAFRSFGSGRSIWTMNGTVLRIAQLMGLHRDGKFFNLSPFDQEMRHRLWWRIVTTEGRTHEDHGMWITGSRSMGDTRLPLNIDDRDINPDMTSVPPERTGFTEMTPLLAICHIQSALEAVSQLSSCADLESYLVKLPAARNEITRTRRELEERFFCDASHHIPVQRLFRNGTKMVLDKLDWRCQERLVRHQQRSGDSESWSDVRVCCASDDLFARACELLDASLELVSNDMYASFIWHSSSYLPYELLTFVLWRLYLSPSRQSADEAWRIVLRAFSIIEETTILPDKGPRWSILCKLKDKVASLKVNAPDAADAINSSNGHQPNAAIQRDVRELNNDRDLLLDDKLWDTDDLLFSTDWTTFQQGLNTDGIQWP